MKITIEHSKTKRNINGDFNICGDEGDLRQIAKQILQQIGDNDHPLFTYGWVNITEPQQSIANTKPKNWDDNSIEENNNPIVITEEELLEGI